MRGWLTGPILLALPAALGAQVLPAPGADTPRVQTVQHHPDSQILLTMLPDTPITVMLLPGETITNVTPGAGDEFRVRVSSERNSLMILPTENALAGTLAIETKDASYSFILRVEQSLAAALLVRFVAEKTVVHPHTFEPDAAAKPAQTWHYRLRGDREVRPASIVDDGVKTRISYAPGQSLPAVFAVGPTGEEEVVNGYMRDEIFVIDRVYEELVFRIDREKATAQRYDEPEKSS